MAESTPAHVKGPQDPAGGSGEGPAGAGPAAGGAEVVPQPPPPVTTGAGPQEAPPPTPARQRRSGGSTTAYLRYVGIKLVGAAVSLLAVLVTGFFLFRLIPGDPVKFF